MLQEGFKTLITGYKVNPIMASQDAEDTSTELYACINLFENEWNYFATIF